MKKGSGSLLVGPWSAPFARLNPLWGLVLARVSS
jgi:hypothetical protein